MMAFLTGSQVYGKPTEDSDVDLVLFMRIDEMAKMLDTLKKLGDKIEEANYGDGQTSVKIGHLNMLICHTERRYLHWSLGTKALKLECNYPLKVTRERAIEVFSGLRKMLNLK